MQQQSADRQARLATLLANGIGRVANQSPLSKVQWLCLALFVACAVILGFILQPRQQETVAFARDPLPLPVGTAAPDAPSGEAAASGAATAGALDRLAVEVAKINQKLDEIVLSQKQTTFKLASLAVGSRSGQAGPAADATVAKRDAGPSRDETHDPVSRRPGERGDLTVHRRPQARADAERKRAAQSRAAAGPAALDHRVRNERTILRERRRRLVHARAFLAPPLRF